MKPLLLLLLLGTCAQVLMAQPEKRIYLANDDHTDYMWTANEATYRSSFIKMLDYYLDQADKTAHLPRDFQNRFNCDGNFWLWEYEKNQPAADFTRLISRVKSGHIGVPFNAVVSCYGGMPAEAVLRGMYYAGYLERKYGLKLDLAVAMENQTLPLGLGSLWAGSGARYSWKGICGCASKLPNAGSRPREIYWYKGLDDSRILMKWNSLFGKITPASVHPNQSLGGYAEARFPRETVHFCTTDSSFRARYPYQVIGAFGKGWDDLETLTDEFVKVAQDSSRAGRRVIVSNEADFFEDFEKTYGKEVPEAVQAFGNEWDLYSASLAELSAKVKRSVEKLRAAEALATLVSLQTPDFGQELDEKKERAWMALGLYWEHNWTADGPISRGQRADWQRKIELQFSSYVDTLYSLARQKLGEQIKKKGELNRFYVFNPLSWTRTDFCDLPYDGNQSVRVIDLTTRREVPAQVLSIEGRLFLRILATDIPSVGYKVYEIQPGEPSFSPMAGTLSGTTLENEYFRISLTSQGVITSLVDKRADRELVREVNGQFMNDLGAGRTEGGTMTIENQGPVSITIACTGNLPLAHTTRLTLFIGVPRLEIENRITQNFGATHSWAFSHNLPEAEVWHEEVGAVIKAKTTTEGGHYAPTQARYDWLTLNHFAAVTTGTYSITISSPDCQFMKTGNSRPDSLDTDTPQLSILAGGHIDGAGLGIPNQGGDSLFLQRFALSTHPKFDAATSMRSSLEHQNPLVGGLVIGTQAHLPGTTYSFLQLSDPAVLLWSFKPAEERRDGGMIARVWNFGGTNSKSSWSFSKKLKSARKTTHLETDTGEANVKAGKLVESIGHHQMKTFRLIF